MVSEDDRWEADQRKKKRDELASRIGRTDRGSEWLGRVNRIGLSPSKVKDFQEKSDDEDDG